MGKLKKNAKGTLDSLKVLWDDIPDELKREIEKKVREILKEAAHAGLDAFRLAIGELRRILKNKKNPVIQLDELQNKIETAVATSQDENELNSELFTGFEEASMDEIYENIDNNETLNVIFVGGSNVLYNIKSIKPEIDDYIFNDQSIQNLKVLTELTNSYLVITAGLRKTSEGKQLLEEKLAAIGLQNKILGYTKKNNLVLKKEKIKSWVKQQDLIDNYVVLDSSTDMGRTLKPHLVLCKNGITSIEVAKCKEILEN